MRYVALLRGINVGGKSKVEMARLKAVFEQAGAMDVSTYINSGNVLFTDSPQPDTLITLFESAIESEFGFKVPIVLRTANQIKTLIDAIPSKWTNDTVQRTDVMFLWPNEDNEAVLQKIPYQSIDRNYSICFECDCMEYRTSICDAGRRRSIR